MRNLRFAHRQENHTRREVFEKITQYAFPLTNKLVCLSLYPSVTNWYVSLYPSLTNCYVSLSTRHLQTGMFLSTPQYQTGMSFSTPH